MTSGDLDFERDGVVVLPTAFDASGMADAMWGALSSRHGVVRDDPSTWAPGFFGKLTRFGKSGPFAAVSTPAIDKAVGALLGDEWHAGQWGQPLITFPTPGRWDVPKGWHVDFPPASPLRAVRMFAYLSEVEPGGGGTLVVTGSHRLAAEHVGARSKDVRAHLAERSAWFRDLFRPVPGDDRVARFMTDGAEVEGVPVRVVELTGEPGDVVLWHPALLHAGSPNCSDHPRFMLTNTAYRSDA